MQFYLCPLHRCEPLRVMRNLQQPPGILKVCSVARMEFILITFPLCISVPTGHPQCCVILCHMVSLLLVTFALVLYHCVGVKSFLRNEPVVQASH